MINQGLEIIRINIQHRRLNSVDNYYGDWSA